jgi:hypothetical protein
VLACSDSPRYHHVARHQWRKKFYHEEISMYLILWRAVLIGLFLCTHKKKFVGGKTWYEKMLRHVVLFANPILSFGDNEIGFEDNFQRQTAMIQDHFR